MDLDALLGRKGLDHGVRLLILAELAILPADWARFDDAIGRAQAAGVVRAHVEEMLLQAVLFFGFPRLVTAFERLQQAWPPASPPAGGDVPAPDRAAAGEALFAAIYGPNAAPVRALLLGFHRAFHDFVLEAAYGRILARPGLPPRTRELLAVAALAALDQAPQMVAHGRGALAFGAEPPAVHEALVCALGDSPAAGAALRRILGR